MWRLSPPVPAKSRTTRRRRHIIAPDTYERILTEMQLHQGRKPIETPCLRRGRLLRMSVTPAASQTRTPGGGAIIRAAPSIHDAASPGRPRCQRADGCRTANTTSIISAAASALTARSGSTAADDASAMRTGTNLTGVSRQADPRVPVAASCAAGLGKRRAGLPFTHAGTRLLRLRHYA